MQWRRGLAFAAVHLGVAIPIVVSLEAGDAMWLHQSSHHASSAAQPLIVPASLVQDTDSAPDFSPCGMIDETSPRQRIVMIANPPAAIFTAWRMFCAPPWSISGMLIGTTWEHPTPAKFAKQRTVDGILLVLIAIQWLLIGCFPLRPHESLKRDPAFLITICTAAAGILSFVPQIDALAGLPMLIAAIAWLFWLALLLWKLIRSFAAWISSTRPRNVQ